MLHDAGSHASGQPGDTALTAPGGWRTRVRFQGSPNPDKAPGRQANFSPAARSPPLTLTLRSYRHTLTRNATSCNAAWLLHHLLTAWSCLNPTKPVIRIIGLPSKDYFYLLSAALRRNKTPPSAIPGPVSWHTGLFWSHQYCLDVLKDGSQLCNTRAMSPSEVRFSLHTYHAGEWRPFFNFVSVCAAVQLQCRPLSSTYTLPAQTHASQRRSTPCYLYRQGYFTDSLRGAASGRQELLELQGHLSRSLICGVTKTLRFLRRCCSRIPQWLQSKCIAHQLKVEKKNKGGSKRTQTLTLNFLF